MDSALTAFVFTGRRLARRVVAHGWLALGVACPLALAFGLAITWMPDRHQARARVQMDAAAVAGLTVGTTERVSRPMAEMLVALSALGLSPADPLEHDDAVSTLMDTIEVRPAGAAGLLDLSYQSTDPVQALQVVQALVDLLAEAPSLSSEAQPKDPEGSRPASGAADEQPLGNRTAALGDPGQRLQQELTAARGMLQSYRQELAAQGTAKSGGGTGAADAVRLRVAVAEAQAEVDTLTHQLEAQQQQQQQQQQQPAGLHGASFRVVEPPALSATSGFPGRLAWAGLAVLATGGAALLAALLAGRLRPTVDDLRTLQAASGRAVLGSVSMAAGTPGSRALKLDRRKLACAVAVLGTLQLAWMGWLAWSAVSRGVA